jgi:hypothetical protein
LGDHQLSSHQSGPPSFTAVTVAPIRCWAPDCIHLRSARWLGERATFSRMESIEAVQTTEPAARSLAPGAARSPLLRSRPSRGPRRRSWCNPIAPCKLRQRLSDTRAEAKAGLRCAPGAVSQFATRRSRSRLLRRQRDRDARPREDKSDRADRGSRTLEIGRQRERAPVEDLDTPGSLLYGRAVVRMRDRALDGDHVSAPARPFTRKHAPDRPPLHSFHSGGPGQSSQPRLVETAQRYAGGA